MKQKFPFTPAGVDDRMNTLYAQDDASVELEAQAVESDLFGWTESNFELSSTQVDYMHSLGEIFADDTGAQLAFCFRHRFPVTMTKGEVEARGYKFIRPTQQVATTYAPDREPVLEGSLEVYIS